MFQAARVKFNLFEVIAQFDGYFQRKDVSLADFEPRSQSIQAILGIEEACQTQVLKQPDVLMLLYLLPDLFDHETLRANYAYYTPRTDLTLVITRRNGEVLKVPMTCRLDSDEEVAIYEAGGVLQRFAQDFLEGSVV